MSAYGFEILPGDIWEEEDGDYCFIIEKYDADISGESYAVVAYYNATWSSSPSAFAGQQVVRHVAELDSLIYRQEEDTVVFHSPGLVQSLNRTTRLGSFKTKDSGEREVRPSGYQRDTQSGKARYDLMFAKDVPYEAQMVSRLAQLLARGAEKYNERNWEKADDVESLERFKSSAFRHLIQWITGEVDEDHAAAVMYNVLAHESTKWKMDNQ